MRCRAINVTGGKLYIGTYSCSCNFCPSKKCMVKTGYEMLEMNANGFVVSKYSVKFKKTLLGHNVHFSLMEYSLAESLLSFLSCSFLAYDSIQ